MLLKYIASEFESSKVYIFSVILECQFFSAILKIYYSSLSNYNIVNIIDVIKLVEDRKKSLDYRNLINEFLKATYYIKTYRQLQIFFNQEIKNTYYYFRSCCNQFLFLLFVQYSLTRLNSINAKFISLKIKRLLFFSISNTLLLIITT